MPRRLGHLFYCYLCLLWCSSSAFTTRFLAQHFPQTSTIGWPSFVVAKEGLTDDATWTEEDAEDDGKTETSVTPNNTRWKKLNKRMKERIIKEGQERAIANKRKREPARDKKRSK